MITDLFSKVAVRKKRESERKRFSILYAWERLPGFDTIRDNFGVITNINRLESE